MDFNEQLNRMKDLMTYGKVNESTANPMSTHTLEYKAEAADGKTYGIIRECNKYYIKLAEKGKETLAEAYQYLGGFNNKKNYEYESYANALKNFELKMSSINEAQRGYDSISTDNKASFIVESKEMDDLSESMRNEIARQRQIMHNTSMLFNESCQIGKTPFTSQPEAEHANSGDKDAPFTNAAKAEPEFGGKKTTPKEAGTPFSNGNAKKKAEKGKDVKVDGSVASQKPSGAKAVKMNEGIEDVDLEDDVVNMDDDVKDVENDVDNLDIDMKDEPVEDGEFDNGEDGDIVDIEGDDFDDEDSDKNDEDDKDFDDDEETDSDDDEEDSDDDKETNDEEDKDSEDEFVDDEDSDDDDDDDDEVKEVPEDEEGNGLITDGDYEEDDYTNDEDEIEECGMPDFENLSESKKRLMNKLTNMIVNEVMNSFGDHPGFRKQPMTMPPGGDNTPFATSKGDSKPYSSCYKSGDANICKNKDIVDEKMRKKIMRCLNTDKVKTQLTDKICEAVMKNLKKMK